MMSSPRLAVMCDYVSWSGRKTVFVLLLIFAYYALASVFWSQGDQLLSAVQLLSLIVCFLLGLWSKWARVVWIVVASILALNTAIAFAQWHYLIDMQIRSAGVIGNQNYAGAALALAIAASLAYRIWWFVPIGGYGVWLSQSRTAVLALGVTAFAWFYQRYKATAIVSLLLTVPLIVIIKDDLGNSLWTRIGIWQDTLNHLTIFGKGWGSFLASYQSWPIHTNMTMEIPPHAYNDFLELVFELGIGSLPLWLALILSAEHANERDWLILACFFVLSLTYFPLSIPVVAQLFVFTLGHGLQERKADG